MSLDLSSGLLVGMAVALGAALLFMGVAWVVGWIVSRRD